MRHLSFGFVCFLFAATSPLCAAESATLDEVRAIQSRELATLQSNAVNATREALEGYGAALAAREQEARNAGDLDGVQALIAERARFAASSTLTAAQIVARPESLRALQERLLRHLEELNSRSNQGVVRLFEQALARLEGLKRDLTRQGDLVGAQAAAAARTAAEQHPAYTRAQFELAEWRARNGAAAAATPAPTPVDPQAAAAAARLVTSREVTVYAPGTLPPPAAGAIYRDQSTTVDRSTEALSVRVRGQSKSDTDNESLRRPLRVVEREARSDSLALQLTLQRKAPGARGAVVAVVEHFGSRANNPDKRCLAVQIARVTELGERLQVIDFPPVTVTSTQTEVNWRGGADDAWRNGAQLAGFVISLFDGQGALLWRAASDAALVPLSRGLQASAAPPPAPPVPAEEELLRLRRLRQREWERQQQR